MPHSDNPKHILEIIKNREDKIFDAKDCKSILDHEFNIKVKGGIVSQILRRLHKRNLIIKSQKQFRDGHKYTLNNLRLIEENYRNFVMPYDFENKEEIINLIFKSDFKKLRADEQFPLDKIEQLKFVQKYGFDYFKRKEVQEFLVVNVGFLMFDGHLPINKHTTQYCFRREKDAILFKKDFEAIFKREKLRLLYSRFCYRVNICSVPFANLMQNLGVPPGKKVLREFFVPNWIYLGGDELKKKFISTAFGNEGSAPSFRYKRIQFVNSKCKEKVTELLTFINQLRNMLCHFGISTTPVQLRNQGGNRKFHARFYIKEKENLIKFHHLFEFYYASEKQQSLEEMISRLNI